MAVWVRFGVQLDYSCRLKSVSSDGENRVLLFLELCNKPSFFMDQRTQNSKERERFSLNYKEGRQLTPVGLLLTVVNTAYITKL